MFVAAENMYNDPEPGGPSAGASVAPPPSSGAKDALYVTGHSLGAATEAGWDMSARKPFRALTISGSGLLAAGAFLGQRFLVGRWLLRLLQVRFSLEDH